MGGRGDGIRLRTGMGRARPAVNEFSCGDVLPGCGALFRAGSRPEVEALVELHARIGHGLTELDMPVDITARIRAAIRQVGAAAPVGALDPPGEEIGPRSEV